MDKSIENTRWTNVNDEGKRKWACGLIQRILADEWRVSEDWAKSKDWEIVPIPMYISIKEAGSIQEFLTGNKCESIWWISTYFLEDKYSSILEGFNPPLYRCVASNESIRGFEPDITPVNSILFPEDGSFVILYATADYCIFCAPKELIKSIYGKPISDLKDDFIKYLNENNRDDLKELQII